MTLEQHSLSRSDGQPRRSVRYSDLLTVCVRIRVTTGTPAIVTARSATTLVSRKSGSCDTQRQTSSSNIEFPILKTRKCVKNVPMKPTAVSISKRSGTTSSVSIEAQTSGVGARPSRPGKERAWTTERKVANDTNERMSTMEVKTDNGGWPQASRFSIAPLAGSSKAPDPVQASF